MDVVEIELIQPSWVVHVPAFRVHLAAQRAAAAGMEATQRWWRLTNVSALDEVLNWIRQRTGEGPYTVYVESNHDTNPVGLIQITEFSRSRDDDALPPDGPSTVAIDEEYGAH